MKPFVTVVDGPHHAGDQVLAGVRSRVPNVLDLFGSSCSEVLFDDGSTVAVATLADDGCRVAASLAARGLEAGDRIAVWHLNGLPYLRMLAACAAGGFVAVSINTRYSATEAARLIRRSGSRLVVVDRARRPLVPDGVDALGGDDVDAMRMQPAAEPVGGPDAPFVVFTTSGTTNEPKMVLHLQRSIAVHARDVARSFPMNSNDIALIAMPLCGVFGMTAFTSAVAGGASIVMPAMFDAESTGGLIAEHAVTTVHGSDDMFHRLLEAGADLASIRAGGYGRFNTSLDGIVQRCEAAGAKLLGLYGMSEVQALFAGRNPNDEVATRWPGGGRLMSPEASYRVVDGELHVKGPSLFAGYLTEGGECVDADLTDSAFEGDWFCTGDLAEPDGDRSFTYIARMGDAMRLGGFLVAPSEIEQALMEIDGVEDAQVVAVDRPSGARPVAFVIASGPVHEQAAIEHCASRLARYKVPVRVTAIDAFPTTPSANGNKIQKAKLRSLAESLLT